MLYITRPGDTWMRIAKEHYGLSCTERDFLSLIRANSEFCYTDKPSHDLLTSPCYQPYYALEHYRAIWLPDIGSPTPSYFQLYLDQLNYLAVHTRKKISDIQQSGIGVQHAVAAVQMAKLAKEKLDKESSNSEFHDTIDYLDDLNAFLATGESKLNEILEDFIIHFKEMQKAYIAKTAASPRRKLLLENAYLSARNRAQADLNKGIKHIVHTTAAQLIDAEGHIHPQGLKIRTQTAFDALENMTHHLKIGINGAPYVDLLLMAINVGITADGDGDWQKEVTGDAASIAENKVFGDILDKAVGKFVEERTASFLATDGVIAALEYIGIGAAVTATLPAWAVVMTTTVVGIGAGIAADKAGEWFYSALGNK